MKDEEVRESVRTCESGGPDERAAFVAGLLRTGAPCRACSGSRIVMAPLVPALPRDLVDRLGGGVDIDAEPRVCHVCLGTGLAIDRDRLSLAAAFGDPVAKAASECGFCGGRRSVLPLAPAATNAASGSVVCYYLPRGEKALTVAPTTGTSATPVTVKVWPEYQPCLECAWRAELGLQGVVRGAFRRLADIVGGSLGEAWLLDLVAVEAALEATRELAFAGDWVLADALVADAWTKCPCPKHEGLARDAYEARCVRSGERSWVCALLDVASRARLAGTRHPGDILSDLLAMMPGSDEGKAAACERAIARACMRAIPWD